jgi:hypothetical protein
VKTGQWQRSSFCQSGECAEVWDTGHGVYVRSSRYPDGHLLHFSPSEWSAFLAGAKAGEFDQEQRPAAG